MKHNNYKFVASTLPQDEFSFSYIGLKLNDCGIVDDHAFSILDVFELYNPVQKWKVDHRLYMIRDPRGPMHINQPTTNWNPDDSVNWKPEYISQVPGNIDPTDNAYFRKSGVFFLDHDDFKRCFSGFA